MSVVLLFGGCGSSEEVERDLSAGQQLDSVAHVQTTRFETRVDTVSAERAGQHTDTATLFLSAPNRFMVQIGSFRKSENAGEIQGRARQRYQVPVVNEYNTPRRLFQVRIGFFETEEAARQFVAKLRGDFPLEYKDAWVVQIGK